jgi:hypothetical protein
MSKVKIEGNASGTGTFTIAAPNSNTDRTFNLPDEAGTVLTSASDIAASQLPAGSVIQVVSAINTTLVQPSTATTQYWFSAGTQASITPTSASSKILVLVQQSYFHENTGPTGMGFRIARNGTDVTTENGFTASYQGADRVHGYQSIVYLDSPSSTSEVTYLVRAMFWATGGDVQLQYGGAESPSRIVLLEIAS